MNFIETVTRQEFRTDFLNVVSPNCNVKFSITIKKYLIRQFFYSVFQPVLRKTYWNTRLTRHIIIICMYASKWNGYTSAGHTYNNSYITQIHTHGCVFLWSFYGRYWYKARRRRRPHTVYRLCVRTSLPCQSINCFAPYSVRVAKSPDLIDIINAHFSDFDLLYVYYKLCARRLYCCANK